ncbi:MAG: hypothetical protein ACLUIS_08465 [Longibaculum sp.]
MRNVAGEIAGKMCYCYAINMDINICIYYDYEGIENGQMDYGKPIK